MRPPRPAGPAPHPCHTTAAAAAAARVGEATDSTQTLQLCLLLASFLRQNIANKNIRAIGLASNAQVVAVGSRDASKSAALLERWGIAAAATAYGSYEAVLADPRVDAVYIPLPSALHLPWVRAAAVAGKHVLLEKPVAVDEEELQAILEACHAAGVQLMDGTM